MAGLLFLQYSDFNLTEGLKGTIMTTKIPGISIALFYSNQCQHCKKLLPIIKSLAGTVQGCQFGIVNVSSAKKCILMSRETANPINVVPYIILYVNGRPYMRYQGPHDKENITKFIVDVTNMLKQNEMKQRAQNQTQHIDTEEPKNIKSKSRKIPDYCLGTPICGDNVDGICYFEFEGAYGQI